MLKPAVSTPPVPAPIEAFEVLRRFAAPRADVERCELCSLELGPEHNHLLDVETRQLLCACPACAILFSGQARSRYRRIPSSVRALDLEHVSDLEWAGLGIPINLAFFVRRGGHIVAVYPSPAGPTEVVISGDVWAAVRSSQPKVDEVEAEVQGLLVNRLGSEREAYVVGLDECYALVGVVRAKWRGFSGGDAARRAVGEIFDRLRRRAGRGAGHARA